STAAASGWFYTVSVRNATSSTIDEMVIFYQRSGIDGQTLALETDVGPGEVRVLNLGACDLMQSYVLGCFIDGARVATLPESGNLPAASASALNPEDTLPCTDFWTITE